MRKVILCLLCCCAAVVAGAQELKVEAFQRMDRDLFARTNERRDLNDVPCAVVRVSVSNANDYSFEGNIIGDVVYKPGEALVYMTQGSRNLTIKSDKFGSLKYEFTQRLEKQVVYKLSMKLITSEANKLRTLVMPVAGIGSTLSFGAMIGIVKKAGGYVKLKANFKNQATELECDNQGMVPGQETAAWFTGATKSSRLAVTGGLLLRLAQPFYVYAGGGYGYKKLAWETVDGQWAENVDETFKGAEAELGCILRLKNFALSAGVQSNSFKYFEATVGVGIMF